MKKENITRYKRMFNLMKPLIDGNLHFWAIVPQSKIKALKKLNLNEFEEKLAMFLLSSPATVGVRGRILCRSLRNMSDYDSIRYLKGMGMKAEEALKTYICLVYKMFPESNTERIFGGVLYCCDIKRFVIACHQNHGYHNLKYIENSTPMFFGAKLKDVKNHYESV